MNKTIINFVRHGKVRNPNNINYGRLLGFPISNEGKEQANATAEYFQKKGITFSAFYTSPQLRTRQTANIINHQNISMITTDLLNEVNSPYDGVSLDFIENRNFDIYSGTPIPYEQPKNILDRVNQFIDEIRLGHSGEEIVAVTHGDVIAFLLLQKKGMLPVFQNKSLIPYPNYASVTRLIFEEGLASKFLDIEYIDVNKKGDN